MDFAPEPATAAGYERYVSESDTDGEGDASGGLHRSSVSSTLPCVASENMAKDLSSTGGEGGGGYVEGGGEVWREGSVFTRLAASWRGSTKQRNRGGIGENRGGNPHHSYGGGPFAPTGRKDAGGGTLWNEIREGGPREGEARVSGGGDRSEFHAAIAGISMRSSSGLKGLKTSLLTDKEDPTSTGEGGGDGGGSLSGMGGDNGVRGGEGGGDRLRGLWDEAGSGNLHALTLALAPGGGGDVHAVNPDGWTAMHSAAHAGHAPVVSLLLRSGASTAVRARRGWTPLHSACMRGRSLATRALLAAGADANVRAGDQRTPLHFACEAGSPECVRELLQAGAAANVSDQDARTPLHFACIDGSTDCVRRLLSAGASPFPPDAWGRDPAAVARQLDRAGPLGLLEDAVAKSKAGGSGRRGSSSSGKEETPASAEAAAKLASATAGGDASGGDCVSDDEGGRRRGDGNKSSVSGREGGARRGGRLSGNRWVVMNEAGRMLERASGKVALFKSMAAAADWGNSLHITSGSFQVAEVAPAMRKAFEKEISFEITGGGTVSEEEEEEEQDPQWTRYRRQQAAAKAGGKGDSRGGGRKRRGAWAVSSQRRDEDEARAVVATLADKLRAVIDERDMHREQVKSLERSLETVLKDCDIAAARIATSLLEGIPAETEAGGKESPSPTGTDPPMAPQGSLLLSVPESASTGPNNEEENNLGCVAAVAAAISPPMLLLGAEDDENSVPMTSGVVGVSADGDAHGDRSSDGISESETDVEVDEDEDDDDADEDDDGDDDDVGTSGGCKRDQDDRVGGAAVRSDDARSSPPLMSFGDRDNEGEANLDDGSDGDGNDDGGVIPEHDDVNGTSDGGGGGETRKGRRVTKRSGGRRGDLLGIDGGGEVESNAEDDDDDDDGGDDDDAVAQERLTAWLSGLKIRRSDAMRYAASLMADGFDSGEALRGVREEDLMQYGMKKGHARLVVRTLTNDGVTL